MMLLLNINSWIFVGLNKVCTRSNFIPFLEKKGIGKLEQYFCIYIGQG